MAEIEKIQAFILRKLVRRRNWGGKHTNIHNLPKGLPDIIRQDKRLLRNAIEALLKQGLLLSKPTHYGLEVSLNIKKKKEMEEFIERFY